MGIAGVILAAVLAAGSPSNFVARLNADIDGRVAAAHPKVPQCLSRFNAYPPGAGVLGFPRCLWESPFKANPDFWLKGVDFSCASPWNDSHGRLRAGTAISRRHIVFAKHFPLAAGTRIAFVGEGGDTSHYTVKATKALDECDIMLGLLDYELTPDVHPAKILPPDFTNYVGRVEGLPVVTLTQSEKAFLSELISMDLSPRHGLVSFLPPKGPVRKLYHQKICGGDSGSPTFLVVGKEPVLLFCLSTSMGGYDYHYFVRQVQKAMDDLCPGYRLEAFDFATTISSRRLNSEP